MRSAAVFGLLGATGLSVAGNAVVGLAIPWLVLERTGSPALAGLIAAAALGPMALSTLVGGALIDRWGRRRMSIGADILSAAAVAALPLLDAAVGLNAGLIAALVALGAVFDGPGMAARETLRPDVARHARLPLERVNAWGEALEGLGNLVAPGIAALLIATVGATSTLWVTVGMFAGAVVLTATMVPSPPREPGAAQPYLRAVVEGLRFVVSRAVLRDTTLVAMLLMLCVAPLVIVLTAQLQRAGSPGSLGLVMTMFAAGGIAGAVAYGAVGHRVRRRPLLLLTLLATGLGLAAFALLPAVPAMAVLAGAVGVASAPINPITAVLLQEHSPPRLRGRVIGNVNSLALLASPLGTAAAGVLLETGGAAVTFLLIGLCCLLAACYAALTPGLRHIEAADAGAPV